MNEGSLDTDFSKTSPFRSPLSSSSCSAAGDEFPKKFLDVEEAEKGETRMFHQPLLRLEVDMRDCELKRLHCRDVADTAELGLSSLKAVQIDVVLLVYGDE